MATYKNKKITLNGVKYTLGDGIGSGGNGYVCAARSAEDSGEYAVKFLTQKKETVVIQKKVNVFYKNYAFVRMQIILIF